MAKNGGVHMDAQDIVLLAPTTITTAVTAAVSTPVKFLAGMMYVVATMVFVYGSGGTNATGWVQTSVDGGLSWIDIIALQATTASISKVSAVNGYIAPAAQAATYTDGTLTQGTIIQGILGNQLRLKYTTTGTYGGSTSLAFYAVAKG